MKGKNIIKKFAAAVMSALMLFSGAAISEHSGTQQIALVAEAAYDDGVILKAPVGERVYLDKYKLYYSPLKNYVCVFQEDGNLVVYRYRSWKGFDDSIENVVWASGTYGHPNAYCCLQADGNLVIYDKDKYGYTYAYFHTHTHVSKRSSTAFLCLSRYGNLRVQHGNTIKWQSHKANDGKKYKAPEPDCVNLVGQWKAGSITSYWNNGKITIDFPDAQKKYMKVTLDCVNSLGGGNATGKVTGFIKIDEINWNTSKEATFTIYKGVKDYESEGEPLVSGDPLAKINMKNEGEKISIKLASFSRFTSHLPTSQYSSS